MAAQALKYTVTHYRKPEHTHEEFIKWIVDVHLPLAVPIFKRHGVIGYSLFVTPESLNTGLKEEMSKFRPTWEFADFDCFIEYTLADMGVIKKVMSDPDWPKAIEQQDDWVDMTKALLSVGYSTPYLLETGEVVNLSK
ncbi:putative dimeric alpha-beta barrel [Rosellinia necatrix]|uniref:Putative dimeric alpha-beta barrel n=1 Tax=Rosellinia necatrix TaxID=77044 RepID=A0A1W2TV96_ROSNE|nr:putative dimeric alpha-beta barrel [Rosellinia necatrix]